MKAAEVSYFKEARFYEKFWTELLSSSFVLRGFANWTVNGARKSRGMHGGCLRRRKPFRYCVKMPMRPFPIPPFLAWIRNLLISLMLRVLTQGLKIPRT